jgi:protein deglycase
MEQRVLVPMADGSEELETIAIVDVLRRSGANVTLAGIETLHMTASKGVKIVADRLLSECTEEVFDLIALPGGMPGAEHLRDSLLLLAFLKRQADEGRFIGAICASPAVVLHPHGFLHGRRFTCHPNFTDGLTDGQLVADTVVVDRNLITSRGAGTAVDFALALVGLIYGSQTTGAVRKGMAL